LGCVTLPHEMNTAESIHPCRLPVRLVLEGREAA
jgi:hypothetical protein